MECVCSKTNSLDSLVTIGKPEVAFLEKMIFSPYKCNRALCETYPDTQLHCNSSEYSETGKGVDVEELHSTVTEVP